MVTYNWTKKDENGKRIYRKLQKPRLVNHKIFDPERDDQRHDYYYSLLLFFVPFRDKVHLLLPNERPEEAFYHLLSSNTDCSAHHIQLQKALEAQAAVRKINEARQDANQDDSHTIVQEVDEPQLMGEAKVAMKEVFDLNVNGNEPG